jgi:hypothetical protein
VAVNIAGAVAVAVDSSRVGAVFVFSGVADGTTDRVALGAGVLAGTGLPSDPQAAMNAASSAMPV